MARKKLGKPSLYVKNMSIEDVLNLDPMSFGGMKEANVRHITTRLLAQVRKRLKELETVPYGYKSPAYADLVESAKTIKGIRTSTTAGGRKTTISGFSIKGLSEKEVRRLAQRAREFLKTKTSTKEGLEKFLNDLERKTGVRLETRRLPRFYRLYRKLEKKMIDVFSKLRARGISTDQVLKTFAEIYKTNGGKMNQTQLFEKMEKALNELTEEERSIRSIQSYFEDDE